jgi:Heterokaryon incompatibility protein Het-C
MPSVQAIFLISHISMVRSVDIGILFFAFNNIAPPDKAFRHGDIENILENLVKTVGGSSHAGGGLLGFAKSVIHSSSGGVKFSKSDVKKVYFVRSIILPRCHLITILTWQSIGKLVTGLLSGLFSPYNHIASII